MCALCSVRRSALARAWLDSCRVAGFLLPALEVTDMKRSLAEHATRFDEMAGEYDEDRGDEYEAGVSLVIEHADPSPTDTVLDVGTGTGTIALALAPDAGTVLGRDISEGMLEELAGLEPHRVVLGDVMFFGTPDPGEPFYSPDVDDPATVGILADAFTAAGYALTAVERIHEQVGVLVAERVETVAGSPAGGS